MANEKKDNVFWPDVTTITGAKKAAGFGMAAAVVVAGLTAVVATIALVGSETVLGFVDAWAYVDAVVFGAIAFGIHKESRFAAVAGLLLFIVEKAMQIQTTGELQGAVMAIFIVVFFVSGTRGVFALHRLRQSETESTETPAA